MSDSSIQETAGRALSDALQTSFRLLKFVLIFAAVLYPFSGVFRVQQHQQAIVLRLGKLRGIYGPGIHLGWPKPLDERILVDAARVQTLKTDAFWYALTEEERVTGRESPDFPNALVPGRDGYSLTGDGNILHTRWELRYRIARPAVFMLEVHEPTQVLEDLVRASVTGVSHRFRIDDALYEKATQFRAEVERELRRRLREEAPVGVEVEGLYVTLMSPPRQVRDAFDDVLRAEQERSRVVNEARGYAVGLSDQAAAEAARTVAEAEAWAKGEVALASAEARRFEELLARARAERSVVVSALYFSTLQRVARQVDCFLLDTPPGKTPEIRIMLNPEPRRARRAEGSGGSGGGGR